MARINQYLQDGTQIASVLNTGVSQGGVCYIGNGLFAVCSAAFIDLFRFDGPSTLFENVGRIVTFAGAGAGEEGKSVTYDGHQLVAVVRLDTGAPPVRTYEVRQYLTDGTLLNTQYIGDSGNEGGVTFDGHQFIASYQNTAASNQNRIIRFILDGPTYTNITDQNISATSTSGGVMANDLDFDGKNLWTLEGSNVRTYHFNGAQNAFFLQAWSVSGHGTGPAGVTTDGHYIYVMFRN